MKVIYWCPASNNPIGGIRVIYQHCDALNELGVDAQVYHWKDTKFRCNWFENDTKIKRDKVLNRANDFSIIPEMFSVELGNFLSEGGAKYGIFVQNSYYSLFGGSGSSQKTIRDTYRSASIIITVSDYTTRFVKYIFPELDPKKIVQVTPSAGAGCFSGHKKNIICYMPRKLPLHASLLEQMSALKLPNDWELMALDGLSQKEVFNALSRSSIFVSLSDREGLGLPPIEAAISGNLVVGYTGEGGIEYFKGPQFISVKNGDFIGMFDGVLESIEKCRGGVLTSHSVECSMTQLRSRYSREAELDSLKVLIASIKNYL